MEFESTRAAMNELVKNVGTIKVEQLVRFFRDATDASNMEHYIKSSILSRTFDYDQVRNEVSAHTAPEQREDTIRRKIMAFWVIAYFGYSNVREVLSLKYPSQFLFITEDNSIYDLTVCNSEQEAAVAMRVLKQFTLSNGQDVVNHIAILRSLSNKALCTAVLDMGFDSICVFDEDKIPTYYTKENLE